MQSVSFDPKLFQGVDESQVLKCGKATCTASDGQAYNFYVALVKNDRTEKATDIHAYATKWLEDEDKPVKRQKTESNRESSACLQGTLLNQCPTFTHEAKLVSDDVFEAAYTALYEYDSDLLPKTERKKNFLFVDKIESAVSGSDLGLHMLHTVLIFLKGDFGPAVMNVSPLESQRCMYEKNVKRAQGKNDLERYEARLRIQQHFVRMGFSHIDESTVSWFITGKDYFSKASDPQDIPLKWLTKEEAARLEPVCTDDLPRSAINQQLHDVISWMADTAREPSPMLAFPFEVSADIPNAKLMEICRLVREGASVDRANAIHKAATGWRTPVLFHLLVALGGDVNAPDFWGNRPLHVAVFFQNIEAVRALLDLGADKNVKNRDGGKPVDEVEGSFDGFSRAMLTMGDGDPNFRVNRTELSGKRAVLRGLLQ